MSTRRGRPEWIGPRHAQLESESAASPECSRPRTSTTSSTVAWSCGSKRAVDACARTTPRDPGRRQIMKVAFTNRLGTIGGEPNEDLF
jgi:hypothetical protein